MNIDRERGLIFYAAWGDDNVPDEKDEAGYVYSTKTATSTFLFEPGSAIDYLPTGHLILLDDNGLHARPFDIESMEFTGRMFDVNEPGGRGVGDWTRDGMYLYLRQEPELPGRGLVWVDMQGNETPVPVPPMLYTSFDLSNRTDSLAIVLLALPENDLWLYEIEADLPFRRLTFDSSRIGQIKSLPFWIGNSRRVAYTALDSFPGIARLDLLDVDSGASQETVAEGTIENPLLYGTSITRDGLNVIGGIANTVGVQSRTHLALFALDGGEAPQHLSVSEHRKEAPSISPDGRWIAYSTDALETTEVFVSDFPEFRQKWQVSADGMDFFSRILWAPDGSAIFYRSSGRIMKAAVDLSDQFRSGTPVMLFEDTFYHALSSNPGMTWDIHPDGTKFLFMTERPRTQPMPTEIIVVENWFEVVKEKARAAGALN
jgi:hypothetical protein